MRKTTEIKVYGIQSIPQDFPEGQETERKPFHKEGSKYVSGLFSGETKFFKIGKLDKPVRLKIDDSCKEYSEHPEELEKLVSEIEVTATFDRYGEHFPGNDHKRNIFKITVKRNGREIEFEYGSSVVASSVNMAPSMYDILCTLRVESHCPLDFDEFCLEFGYDTDSIKASKTHRDSLKMRAKIEKIFSSEELEYLPS